MAGMDKDFPAGAMHMPMVRFTQKYAILDAAFAIVYPVPTMVRLTHCWWPIAVRSTLGAVLEFPRARFPGPPSEPDVRLSPHPALHGVMLVGLCSTGSLGLSLV